MSQKPFLEITADELRAMSRKLSVYVELRPDDLEARPIAERCQKLVLMLEESSAKNTVGAAETDFEGVEDRVLRILSGVALSRREIRVAGVFALVWFAMDAFWFISTLNHWFGL
jgi:hypothetical protein